MMDSTTKPIFKISADKESRPDVIEQIINTLSDTKGERSIEILFRGGIKADIHTSVEQAADALNILTSEWSINIPTGLEYKPQCRRIAPVYYIKDGQLKYIYHSKRHYKIKGELIICFDTHWDWIRIEASIRYTYHDISLVRTPVEKPIENKSPFIIESYLNDAPKIIHDVVQILSRPNRGERSVIINMGGGIFARTCVHIAYAERALGLITDEWKINRPLLNQKPSSCDKATPQFFQTKEGLGAKILKPKRSILYNKINELHLIFAHNWVHIKMEIFHSEGYAELQLWRE